MLHTAQRAFAQAAAGLVLEYLEATPGPDTPPLEMPQPAGAAHSMRLDAATQRHLEIAEGERSRERTGGLLATMDRTRTGTGRRMLPFARVSNTPQRHT